MNDDELIPFAKAGRYFPGNPSRETLFRWLLKGVRGVRMETTLCGGRRFISRAAIASFIAAQNQASTATPVVSPSQRARQNASAREALAAIGV